MYEQAAFPNEYDSGMTLRDWFAGLAMGGTLSKLGFNPDSRTVAQWAYDVAQAMLAEKEQREKETDNEVD